MLNDEIPTKPYTSAKFPKPEDKKKWIKKRLANLIEIEDWKQQQDKNMKEFIRQQEIEYNRNQKKIDKTSALLDKLVDPEIVDIVEEGAREKQEKIEAQLRKIADASNIAVDEDANGSDMIKQLKAEIDEEMMVYDGSGAVSRADFVRINNEELERQAIEDADLIENIGKWIPKSAPMDGGKKTKKTKKTKKVRKHSGIVQTGGKAGKLRKGYKYTGRKLKNGQAEIKKVKSKK